jgi:hypothetical protein
MDHLPATVDRATFQAELDTLRGREKAHTHEGDAIAAARRRLPMVEMDPTIPLTGPDGPVTLLDAFEGRRQLIAYYFMWWPGHPAADQCEGCTYYTSQIRELSHLHSRDITYAVFGQGRNVSYDQPPAVPYDESARYRDFMGWDMPWYSAHASLDALLGDRELGLFHLVCYLREERPWTTATRSWTSPSTDARKAGKTRPPAGPSSAPAPAPTAAPPTGRQCRPGRMAAPSPSGRDSQRDTPSLTSGQARTRTSRGHRPH